jgi:hypothetical protein
VAINTQKVVVGGVAAGVVLAALDFLVNGVILADQNAAALNALNPALAENMEGGSNVAAFIVLDLLFGILLTWTYAAIRPRFGPGPKTAVMAGIQVWLVALILYASMTFMGMFAWSYFVTGSVAFLVIMVVGALVGAMLYKEE